ncbi:hypothetical protein GWK47_033436 [Chionoecetes opilio]|uniref:HAT C-terminal dimerisation domain-containing protein n=1 Tax=Chionoecetes opilio TaxID=41210 RepID=A0A8J5D3D2_CHIOP|nr:hypothetical protein GWK47_033436 [Chionoecetes opilio]
MEFLMATAILYSGNESAVKCGPVIFAESLEVLVMALEALHEKAKPLGLKVFWLKTKVQALMNPRPTATEGTSSTHLSNKMGKELESWCSEKQRNKLLEQAMFPSLSHATWVDVFVRYNTAIPSSAAVERLFSQGSDIMKAKRASLTSDNFERLVGLHEREHGPAKDRTITRGL